MELYPGDAKEKMEFDKILSVTQQECMGVPGKEALTNTKFETEPEIITRWLKEVEEYVASFERNDPVPLSHYEPIDDDVFLLRKEGYVLDIEAIRRLYNLVYIGKNLNYYFESLQRRKLAPMLYNILLEGYNLEGDLIADIDRIIDEEGEVRPDASPELLKIHRKITSREKELQSTYGKLILNYKSRGLLADSVESMRNGRRVLTVPAENKRKVEGIIHDESATGKTVFIEPSEVIPLNNEIYNLYTEKKKEIYRVLRDLCDKLRPFAHQFIKIQNMVVRMDVVRAKCRLAQKLDAHRPEIIESPSLGIKQGYNPILKIKYATENRVVVPFDAELHGNNRIIIVSGPNAGGKSVVLKSIGLLQLMVQSGFLIPADPNSKLGIFKKLYVDIGDQQSLEDDLSTYSSHLQNMKYFSEHSDDATLVLIDEFGSGTDPKIGGAIAESVLRKLNSSRVFGVITTHYSNLKYYAFKSKGIVNAAMEFDQAALQPTFLLKIGKPGSSFAYEIASKIGLDHEIIRYAKYKTGKNEKAVDELLVKLQTEKKETEEKMGKLMEREDHLDKLIRNYENLHRELEFRRKKLKLEHKHQALGQLARDNRDLEKAIKEIKEGRKLEEAKALSEKVKKERATTVQQINELKEEVYYQDEVDDVILEVGSYVKMRTGNVSGEILKIRKNIAEVQMGMMKVKIPVQELIPAKEPIELRKKSVSTDLSISREGVRTKLDVRGYTPSDTRKLVEEFLDIALMHNVTNLTIIHGRGSGALRKAVHEKLKEYKDVKSISHPEEEYGGKSITYVKL